MSSEQQTAVLLSALGPSRVKNAQVILASGRVSLYTGQPHLETSRHLDRSLKKKKSDNFRTKTNLKTNYPIFRGGKKTGREVKTALPGPAHGQTDWYRILPPPPALISPRAVSQGNYRGGFRFPADWTTQNFSSHKFLKG